MTARHSGLTISVNVSSKQQTYPWTAISSIILADRLIVVDRDETDCSHGKLILILNSHAEPKSIMSQVKAQIARSGEGKVYLTTDVQISRAGEFAAALRRLAPAGLAIQHTKIATFDKIKKTDTYEKN